MPSFDPREASGTGADVGAGGCVGSGSTAAVAVGPAGGSAGVGAGVDWLSEPVAVALAGACVAGARVGAPPPVGGASGVVAGVSVGAAGCSVAGSAPPQAAASAVRSRLAASVAKRRLVKRRLASWVGRGPLGILIY